MSSFLAVFCADNCRLCERALHLTSAPVCPDCLANLQPLGDVPRCGRCGVPFASRAAGPTCGECRLHEPAYTQAAAFGTYEHNLRELIHMFKYAGMQPLARPLGLHLAQALDDAPFPKPDVVVPVPLHKKRLRQRGFNQAQLLAQQLGRSFQIPVAPRGLLRVRPTAAQAGLSGSARRDNLASAFAPGDPAAVRGQKVLLVDDVLTTGATAHACARTLRRAGAEEVAVLTLARAIPLEVQS